MKQTLFIISILFMAFLGMVSGYKHGYLAATSELVDDIMADWNSETKAKEVLTIS